MESGFETNEVEWTEKVKIRNEEISRSGRNPPLLQTLRKEPLTALGLGPCFLRLQHPTAGYSGEVQTALKTNMLSLNYDTSKCN